MRCTHAPCPTVCQAASPSSFSPVATILSAPSGNGFFRASTSFTGSVSHCSTASVDVRMTGMALGWIAPTSALASVVRNPNS